jgi:xanthine dehydrogenase YagS FAD-binding subunit
MKPFKYAAATSTAGACGMLGEGALPLAGGTNLLNLLKEYVLEPDVLVDIKAVEGTGAIRKISSGYEVGATVTLDEILRHEGLRTDYPVLHQALRDAGTPQIRHRATLGGNLCCRPACWYFAQEGYACAKHGAQGCAAKTGDNEFHAIFETDGPCVMVHPSSAAPALLALGAGVRIAGPDGARDTPLAEFFTPPSTDVRRENVLEPNEIVTHVLLGRASAQSATYEVRQKAASDWPLASASVHLDIQGGVCRHARLYLGFVAPVPWRAEAAEKALAGQRITAEVAEAAAGAAVASAKPLQHNAYKVAAARAAVKRAVLIAATGRWQ